jgi:uncharacterized protein
VPAFSPLFLIAVAAGFLIPVLTTFFHVDIKHAIAVSMLSVIATSSGAASAYLKDRLTNLKVGMFLETFTMAGALAGAALAVHANPRWLYLAFGVVLLLSWSALWFGQKGAWQPVNHPDALSRWLELRGAYRETENGPVVSYHATRAGLGAVCMFGAGAVAGLLGIGAGALKVLIHDLIMGLPAKVSTTTSNLIIGVTALAGASVFLAQGLIEPGLAVPIVLGILVGAWAGTRLLVRLNNRAVRNFFLFVLAVLGVEMLIRGIRYG